MTKIFTTYDEEYDYAGRIAVEFQRFLEEQKLDTVNNEYVVRVEVLKVEQTPD